MLLDFQKIKLGFDGRPEQPTLVLKTLADQTLGVISNAYGVRFEINLADLSTIEFTVPYMVDGVVTPLYDQIVGYKVVWTEAYGIYVLTRPQITGDGVKEVKQVTGYSLEYLREKKQLFLEEGLYKFWNIPGERQNTILGRIAEMFPGWDVSCTDTKLIDTYRYFDQLDVDALGFCYNDVAEKFHCVIAFDVYSKTIHAFDANTSRGTLPIYLSFENLVQSVDVTELTDEIKTKLHVYGADDLSITAVNPTGTDYLVDLSFFVERGDLNIYVDGSTKTLEERYTEWQHAVLAKQELYSGLVASKSALSLQKLMLEHEKSELEGELETHKVAQNVEIQAVATTGSESTEGKLNELAGLIKGVEAQMAEKDVEIKAIDDEIAEANKSIQVVVDELKMSAYFSPAEMAVLQEFLIEGDIVEETFVASDVDASVDGVSSSLDGKVYISGSQITRVDVKDESGNITKTMYGFSGGDITFGDAPADVKFVIPAGRMRGDVNGDGEIDAEDESLVYKHLYTDGFELTDKTQLLAADFIADGTINKRDVDAYTMFSGFSKYRIGFSEDLLGNWSVNEKHELKADPLFYIDIQLSDIKAGDSAVVFMDKEYDDGFFSGECLDGILRVYAHRCPVTEINAVVQISTEVDGVVFQYHESPSTLLRPRATVVRGTAEVVDTSIVMSVYLNTAVIDGKSYENGTLIFTGVVSDTSTDIETVITDGIEEMIGTQLSFMLANPDDTKSNASLSVSTNEYKEYSVARNLFDYGVEALAELATPTYEFSIDSTNFLFLDEFTRFKNEFELGKNIYLNLASEGVIKPNVIGVGVDFTKESSLSLTFSNRYKKENGFKTLESMIKKSYSSGRDFDASKYVIGKTVNQASNVSAFMDGNFDSAKNTIIGAQDQSVVIDAAGISVTNTSKPDYQLRIVNGMIAMTKDGWKTSDVAIGYFNSSSETSDKLGGVNAQLLAGKLIVGNNLVIENNDADGSVTQFKVDGSGAWLSNSRFVLQSNKTNDKGELVGGKIMIDPEYGILAGGTNLFTVNGTSITPSFMNEDGEMVVDDDGMPTNSNFYLDIDTGNAYFRGTVMATKGSIGGWEIEDNQLTSGSGKTYVALNSSSSEDSLYAMWAGDDSPQAAPFSVKRDGTVVANNLTAKGMSATDATFSGNINASTINGRVDFGSGNSGNGQLSFGNNGSGTITKNGIEVKNASGKTTFKVDADGNVTLDGAISWSSDNSPVCVLYHTTLATPPVNYGSAGYISYASYPDSGDGWHKVMADTDFYASYSYDGGQTWTASVKIVGQDGTNGENGESATGTLALYHQNTSGGPSTPEGSYDDFPASGTGWHKSFNSSLDKYVSYSTDGGNTWGPPVQSNYVPSYIKSGYISKTTIMSPNIYGGLFYATGQGRSTVDEDGDYNVAAYYISDGLSGSGSSAKPNTPVGWISYNTGGGNDESQNRIIFQSTSIPIKIKSGSNMSLECANSGKIYFQAPMVVSKSYGSSDPETAVGTTGVSPGTLYFQTVG